MWTVIQWLLVGQMSSELSNVNQFVPSTLAQRIQLACPQIIAVNVNVFLDTMAIQMTATVAVQNVVISA